MNKSNISAAARFGAGAQKQAIDKHAAQHGQTKADGRCIIAVLLTPRARDTSASSGPLGSYLDSGNNLNDVMLNTNPVNQISDLISSIVPPDTDMPEILDAINNSRYASIALRAQMLDKQATSMLVTYRIDMNRTRARSLMITCLSSLLANASVNAGLPMGPYLASKGIFSIYVLEENQLSNLTKVINDQTLLLNDKAICLDSLPCIDHHTVGPVINQEEPLFPVDIHDCDDLISGAPSSFIVFNPNTGVHSLLNPNFTTEPETMTISNAQENLNHTSSFEEEELSPTGLALFEFEGESLSRDQLIEALATHMDITPAESHKLFADLSEDSLLTRFTRIQDTYSNSAANASIDSKDLARSIVDSVLKTVNVEGDDEADADADDEADDEADQPFCLELEDLAEELDSDSMVVARQMLGIIYDQGLETVLDSIQLSGDDGDYSNLVESIYDACEQDYEVESPLTPDDQSISDVVNTLHEYPLTMNRLVLLIIGEDIDPAAMLPMDLEYDDINEFADLAEEAHGAPLISLPLSFDGSPFTVLDQDESEIEEEGDEEEPDADSDGPQEFDDEFEEDEEEVEVEEDEEVEEVEEVEDTNQYLAGSTNALGINLVQVTTEQLLVVNFVLVDRDTFTDINTEYGDVNGVNYLFPFHRGRKGEVVGSMVDPILSTIDAMDDISDAKYMVDVNSFAIEDLAQALTSRLDSAIEQALYFDNDRVEEGQSPDMIGPMLGDFIEDEDDTDFLDDDAFLNANTGSIEDSADAVTFRQLYGAETTVTPVDLDGQSTTLINATVLNFVVPGFWNIDEERVQDLITGAINAVECRVATQCDFHVYCGFTVNAADTIASNRVHKAMLELRDPELEAAVMPYTATEAMDLEASEDLLTSMSALGERNLPYELLVSGIASNTFDLGGDLTILIPCFTEESDDDSDDEEVEIEG